jgi:hypothetical protein
VTLTRSSSIAAVVPHYRCEQWLEESVRSLLAQTRPLQAIIVVDDGSASLPIEIVHNFPAVTLLCSPHNVGPFRLVQQVIEDTNFDGYLFQDADDWSAPGRLALLLAEAERSGAELIGSQAMRVHTDGLDAEPVLFPSDPATSLAERPFGYPLLHPSSLVSRALLTRIGGFASGLRYSGDSEFLRRAVHTATVRNIPAASYVWRRRPESLTTSPETGSHSANRVALRRALARRSRQALAAVRAGRQPDLAPYATAPPVTLLYASGPPIGAHDGGAPPADSAARIDRSLEPSGGRLSTITAPPIMLLGAPQSGAGLLQVALAQHPRLVSLPAEAWLATRVPTHTADSPLCHAATHVTGRVVTGSTFAQRWIPANRALDAAGGARGQIPDAAVSTAAFDRFCAAVAECIAQEPETRVVIALREPLAAARMLVASIRLCGGDWTIDQALGVWLHAAGAVHDLERALPPDAVLRLPHRSLVTCPQESVRRVLDFAGEEYVPACGRAVEDARGPLMSEDGSGLPTEPHGGSILEDAIALWQEYAPSVRAK